MWVPKFKKYSIYTISKSLDWVDSGQSLFNISGEAGKTLMTAMGEKAAILQMIFRASRMTALNCCSHINTHFEPTAHQ